MSRDILGSVVRHVEKNSQRDFRDLVGLLGYLYPSFDASEGNYPYIEEFFAQISMALEFNSETYIHSKYWPPERVQKSEVALKKGLSSFLWTLSSRSATSDSKWIRSVVQFCERVLQPDDVVITFNWDLTIERANSLVSKQFMLRYTYDEKSDRKGRSITLLKPHGSIDWFTQEQAKHVATKGSNDFVRVGRDLYGYNSFTLRPHHHLESEIPAIVSPSPFKTWTSQTSRNIWQSVYRAVRHAKSIKIIGYSLPPEDHFARFVLRRAFRNAASEKRRARIQVINPDSSILDRFERIAGPTFDVRLNHKRFEDWLKAA
jgi:hypothetical protein